MGIKIKVDSPNGRGPRRRVLLTHNGVEHVDQYDPSSGFERQQVAARFAEKLGLDKGQLANLDASLVKAAEDADKGEPIIYPALTAAELDGQQYHLDYLVEGVLARGQHAIGGGPHKTLKTLVLGCDLGLSLATGGHFLGYWPVARPVRTALMSGECGYPVLQDNLRRVARAAGLSLGSIGNLLVSESLPKFGHLDHIEAVGRFISENGLEVCIVDPAYLCFDQGEAAPNVFLMGALLRGMGEMFVAKQATMILLHHATKPAGRDGEPIDLADLSFSGFREFAAQWLLLSRRTAYVPGTGHHELWFSAGGRAGHSGRWAVDVDEGQYQPGVERQWSVAVRPESEARTEAQSRQEGAKERAKEEAARERLDGDKRRVVQAAMKYPGGETAKVIRETAGPNPGRFNSALAALLQDKTLAPCSIAKPCRRAPFEGYRVAE